jgi:hypothetical protein
MHFVLKVENSIRKLLQIKLRTRGGRLGTCVLCQMMEFLTDEITEILRPSDKLYQLSDPGNLSQYMQILRPYKIHIICQMLKMSHSLKYIHVEAL